MDKYSVKLMSQALRDLDQIYSYISQQLLEPETASKLVAQIEDGILSLESMPYRCSERKTGAYADKGYRQLFVKNYTILFRFEETKKQVLIVTVPYSPSQF